MASNDRLNPPWSDDRIELLAWLERNAASLAATYNAAVTLLNDPLFPGRCTLLAFCVRDLVNLLPQALQGATERSFVNYPMHCDRMMSAWRGRSRPAILDSSAPVDPGNQDIQVPLAVIRELHEMLDNHEHSKKKPTAAEAMVVAVSAKALSENVPPIRALVPRIEKARRFFADIHHFTPKDRPDPPEVDIQAQFGVIEATLMSLTKPYFDVKGELDALLRETNTITDQ